MAGFPSRALFITLWAERKGQQDVPKLKGGPGLYAIRATLGQHGGQERRRRRPGVTSNAPLLVEPERSGAFGCQSPPFSGIVSSINKKAVVFFFTQDSVVSLSLLTNTPSRVPP